MRYFGGIPSGTYGRSTAPETCAIPPVIIVRSSDRVMVGMYGAIRIGASVCPMKTLAATARDSAPDTFIRRCITHAIPCTILCMMPR